MARQWVNRPGEWLEVHWCCRLQWILFDKDSRLVCVTSRTLGRFTDVVLSTGLVKGANALAQFTR